MYGNHQVDRDCTTFKWTNVVCITAILHSSRLTSASEGIHCIILLQLPNFRCPEHRHLMCRPNENVDTRTMQTQLPKETDPTL